MATGLPVRAEFTAELRHHCAEIICTQQVVNGQRRFFYTMTKAPKA